MNTKNLTRTITLILLLCAATLIFSSSCFPSGPEEEDTAGGHSFEIDNQFVIIWYGHESGQIIYIVVRNWPSSSKPEDRLADKRLVDLWDEKPKVRLQDGSYQSVAGTPYLYFYDGDNLTSFPISIQESDFGGLKTEGMTSYNDLLKFFRNYETRR